MSRIVSWSAIALASMIAAHASGLVSPAMAQRTSDDDRVVFLLWENDAYFGTDRQYTNGMRIGWSRRLGPGDAPWWLPSGLLSHRRDPHCRLASPTCAEWWIGFSVGQSMFTPHEIEAQQVIRDDRPYAGWLYVSPSFTSLRPGGGGRKAVEHSVQLTLGVVGPPSLAEHFQVFIHDHLPAGADRPAGWTHQLPAEPTLNLLYYGRRREAEARSAGGDRIFDMVSEWSLSAGNVYTHGELGAALRLGRNLGEDLGAVGAEPTVLVRGRDAGWQYYLLGRLRARYVLHNIFLDGGWFREAPHTVDKRPLVMDTELGAGLRHGRVLATLRWVHRSPEFRERLVRQNYGALGLAFTL